MLRPMRDTRDVHALMLDYIKVNHGKPPDAWLPLIKPYYGNGFRRPATASILLYPVRPGEHETAVSYFRKACDSSRKGLDKILKGEIPC